MSKIKILLVILIGLSLPLYIAWKITSVSFEYSSVGEPLSGVKITSRNIGNQNLIIFPEEENYLFDQVKLKIDLQDKEFSENEFRIKAYQNFLATFYPKEEKVLNEKEIKELFFRKNQTDLPVGSLFSNGETISIMYSNNSYRPFFSAKLFLKMGYKWNDVVEKPVGFASELQEGEVFNYGNPHPDGTFLKSKAGTFLVWNEKLFEVDKNVNIEDVTKTSPIEIDSLKVKPFGECSGIIEKNQLDCYSEKDFNFQKSDYVFEITGIDPNNIKEISLELSSSPSGQSLKNNFEVSLEDIKLKLIDKYRGYIPFI